MLALRHPVHCQILFVTNWARFSGSRLGNFFDILSGQKANASLAKEIVIFRSGVWTFEKLDATNCIILAATWATPPRTINIRNPDKLASSIPNMTAVSPREPARSTIRHVNVPRRAGADHSTDFFFDCETTGIDEHSSITCAAVTSGSDEHEYVWHSGQGEPMSATVGNLLVDFLVECGSEQIYTFNGAAFDFKMLYRLTNRAELKSLALNHRDVLVAFVCENRYYSSMDSFAKPTLGDSGAKTNTGAWAAKAWATEEAEKVIDYCVSDTDVLKALVRHVKTWGKLTRIAKSGKQMTWTLASLNGIVPTAKFALAHPASASWMTEPPPLPNVSWANSDTCQ